MNRAFLTWALMSIVFLCGATELYPEVATDSITCESAMTTDADSVSLTKDLPVGLLMQQDSSTKFSPTQLILPSSFIAVGIFGVYHNGFKKLNTGIRDNMTEWRNQRFCHVDDWVQYLPALTYATLGLMRVPCKHSFRERIAIEATAYIVMAAVVNIGKYSFREKRPDSKARNSFPSGHTATVFTGAELMRIEYGWGIGMASYAVATGVAFLRLYNGRHWTNDVIAGAGIGMLSARIGYWMLPLYRKWFKWDKKESHTQVTALIPSYSYIDKNVSLNFSMTF